MYTSVKTENNGGELGPTLIVVNVRSNLLFSEYNIEYLSAEIKKKVNRYNTLKFLKHTQCGYMQAKGKLDPRYLVWKKIHKMFAK